MHAVEAMYSLPYVLTASENLFSEAVLTSTHNLCFNAKIRKNVYPCKPQFFNRKVGCKGVFITRKCVRDEIAFLFLCPRHNIVLNEEKGPIHVAGNEMTLSQCFIIPLVRHLSMFLRINIRPPCDVFSPRL